MDDARVGRSIRAVRIRKGWRQEELAEAASTSQDAVSRLERGLLGGRHSALHEAVAARFAQLPGWTAVPEVTFSIYGERGAIDVLAWHAATRTLLVIELKTEIVDVQELLASWTGSGVSRRRSRRSAAGCRVRSPYG